MRSVGAMDAFGEGMMELYGVELSPFVARARIALRIKGVECPLLPPPGGGTRSAEFLAINPIGKVPVLVTDDGLAIAESETVIDYLDDTYPEPPLLPADPAERARARNLVRTLEGYATPALYRLFGQLDPATCDEARVIDECGRLAQGLALAAKFLGEGPYAAGGTPGKADCLLAPTCLLATLIAGMVGQPDPVAAIPALADYVGRARDHAVIGGVLSETEAALAASQAR
jgi:glutathione S-transferase